MLKKCKNNKITIYLLKSDYTKDNVIKDEYKNGYNDLYSSNICKTFVSESIIKNPGWLTSFFNTTNQKIVTAFPKVVSIYTLEIDGENVSFAIPFGGGKSMLVNDSLVEDFGLKILLNSVDIVQFRQLQISDCGKNFINTSSQLPKLGTVDDFLFDFNTEILKKAVAKCDDKLFANNNIIGGDGITITVPYKCDNIENFLIESYKKYKSDKYKEHFSWLDNIRNVRDSNLKKQLELELINNINNKEFDKVWMAVPEIIDWNNVSCFKFRKRDIGENDISIETFIKIFDNEHIETFNQISSKSVSAYDLNDNESYTWPAHKCLMCEINYLDNIYCYNSGKWYVVNGDYGAEILKYHNSLEISEREFIECSDKYEKEYNKKLCKSIAGSYLMDCNNIEAIESGRSTVELCDVLTNDKELIHIKKGESSSYLSHLFNQARVSSDLLYYENFRKKANAKIGNNYFNNDFKSSDYTIILGIITNKEEKLPKIPFFSKVAIKYLVQDLTKMGYTVKLKNIFCNIK